jgi:hypothetical protein
MKVLALLGQMWPLLQVMIAIMSRHELFKSILPPHSLHVRPSVFHEPFGVDLFAEQSPKALLDFEIMQMIIENQMNKVKSLPDPTC